MENFIKETILRAGESVMRFFGDSETISNKYKKTIVDIVTKADVLSSKIIVNAIKKQYPEHGIVSEESEKYKINAEYIWYVDPLDGTKNFASRVPLFGINIAVAHKGKVLCAAIYLPSTKEFCFAEKGKGAFLNGKKISCSKKENWEGSYGLGPIRFSQQYVKFQEGIEKASSKTSWTNSIASPAVCAVWIADGRREWYIGPSKNSWDYAAPSLIAKEAGCVVSNFNGEEWKPGDRGLIMTNKFLYPKLIEIIKQSYPN